MSVPFFFIVYVILFTFLGLLRGWVKESVLTFGVIMALAINLMLRKYIPLIAALVDTDPSLFWMRILMLLIWVYFSYRTVVDVPVMAERAEKRDPRHRIFDLGLGLLNGYLFVGSLLFYMHLANYPLPQFVGLPSNPTLLEMSNLLMVYMPPQVLGEPGIYFAEILAFVAVIVIYVGLPARTQTRTGSGDAQVERQAK